MNQRTRRWAGGSVAALGAALLIGPVTAFAQSDDDSTPTTEAPTTTAPGVSDTDDEATTPRPLSSWIQEVLDALVEAGTLTQAQADAVTQALEEARPARGGLGPGGPRGHRHGPWRLGVRIELSTAAETIGISGGQLRRALRDGQTLAEIAEANDVDPQAVIDALGADATERLDQAVADGRRTQAEADELLSELTDRITTAVNEGFPAGGKWHHHDEDSDDGDGTETTDTTQPDTTTTTTPGGS